MERVRSRRTAANPELYAEELRDPAAYERRMAEQDKAKARTTSSEVGYCKPPEHSRWIPGQSGNRLGRPAGSHNLRTLVQRIFAAKIRIRLGDTIRTVTRLEAAVLASLNNAMKGDHRAIREVLSIATSLGLMDDQPQKLVLGNLSSFTNDELIEFRSLLIKAGPKTVPSK